MTGNRRVAAYGSVAISLVVLIASTEADPWRFGEASVEGVVAVTDSVNLRYRVFDRGPDTVVVLHGGPGLHMRYLFPAIAPVAGGRTFIFYDQRGRGESGPLSDSSLLSTSSDVGDLEALRRHFGLERMTIVAEGWGSALVLRYAELYPDRIARVALVSPLVPRPVYYYHLAHYHADTAAFARYSTAVLAGLDSLDPAAFCRQHWGYYLSPASITRAPLVRRASRDVCAASPSALRAIPAVNRLVARDVGTTDWRPVMKHLTAPVLLVQGADHPVLSQAAREWRAELPDSRLLELSGPAQFIWLEARDEFRAAVDAFLGGRWPEGAR